MIRPTRCHKRPQGSPKNGYDLLFFRFAQEVAHTNERYCLASESTSPSLCGAYRARDRGASGDRRSLPESGRDRSAPVRCVGTATAGKTGQRKSGDLRVGRSDAAKPANENALTTGFGVALRDSERESPQPVPSICSSSTREGRLLVVLHDTSR